MTIDLSTILRLERLTQAEVLRARRNLRLVEDQLHQNLEEIHRQMRELRALQERLVTTSRQGLSPQEIRLIANESEVIQSRLEACRREEETWKQRQADARRAMERKLAVLQSRERCRQRLMERERRLNDRREARDLDELATQSFVRGDER